MGPPAPPGEPPGAVQLASAGDAEAGGGAFQVGADELAAMTHKGDLNQLRNFGGVVGVCALLQVSPGAGVENLDSEAARRTAHFGANVFPEKPPRSILFYIWDAMQDFLVQMLFVCAVASLAISIPSQGISEGFYDAIGIFIALFLIISVAAGSNYRQAQQFRALNREKKRITMEVTRSGHRMRLGVEDIVVGDVVHLRTGDHVPTDGLVLAAHSLSIDESSLTGESHLVHKSAEQPFLLAGCNVMDGFGDMLATAVGPRTEWGRVLAAITEDSDDPTPLQVRLMKLAEILGAMGIVIGVAIFLILSIRFLLTSDALKHFTAADGRVLLNYFTIAITVLVIAIPEGLPLAVTLMLAFSVGKMMADKCLVRHLSSCETMGCSTTICSDKTGTLTLNQMTVVSVWAEGEYRMPETCSVDVSRETVQLLNEGLALNTSGSIDQTILGAHPTVSGSPTEKSLLSWGLQMGLRFEEARRAAEMLHVEPFNSSRKSMAVLVQEGQGGPCRVHWKGAPDILLDACQYTVGPEHTVTELTQDMRDALSKALKEMGSQSLRTMALAYREVTPGDATHILEQAQAATSPRPTPEGGAPPPAAPHAQHVLPSDGLVLLALVGIKDPCRPEVPDAVRQCQGAGIMVRMVTGDSMETASAIASECGILTPGGTVMDGAHFRAIDPADMPAALQTLQVVARASPTDKLLLVQQLKAAGEVVAVTGDGTNDAPALHEADVGLAMGLCGTEVAKESADIIILDDNFASIVRAVVWGRSVFSNIQRFLQFQITVNVVALTLTFISAVVTGDSPMTVVQLLWVDLIQDTLGAMALATEPPSERALLSPPVGRSAKIVSAVMWRNIVGQSLYQLAILNTLWFKGKELLHLPGPPGIPHVVDASGAGLPAGDAELVTIIFSVFVFMSVFNQLNSRKLEDWNVFSGVLRNRLFVAIFLIELVIQFIVAQFLGKISGCVPLTAAQWGMCFLLGAGCVPFGMITKLVPIPGHKPRQRRGRGWKNVFQGGAGQFERLDGAAA